MSSGIAHEINNPIMIIQNYISLMKDEIEEQGKIEIAPDSDFYSFLKEILVECNRISMITKNLLEFSRLGSKNPQKTDLESVLLQVLTLLQPTITKAQIQVKINTNTNNSQCAVRSDQIKQVIVNLLDNSIDSLRKKYPHFGCNHNQKYIEISISSQTIKHKGEVRNYVLAEFYDDGMGIEDKYHQHIFEPFFTTKKSKEDLLDEQKYHGLGLGLAYCQKIVQDHGGFIDFESKQGEFARFIINIPAYEFLENDSSDDEDKEIDVQAVDGKDIDVKVIDDKQIDDKGTEDTIVF
ncbi:MAG: sensor histidine kinase [Promethearchaeota archaeon]